MDKRDRSVEAGRYLAQAITDNPAYDLDDPMRTSDEGDWYDKVDWYFHRRIDPVSGLRPPGRVFAGVRYLDSPEFDGQYATIRNRPGKEHPTEYAVWMDKTTRISEGYWFYLFVWPSVWRVVDMLAWRAKRHIYLPGVHEDPLGSYLSNPKAWEGQIPFDQKCFPDRAGSTTCFYRFPVPALTTIDMGWR